MSPTRQRTLLVVGLVLVVLAGLIVWASGGRPGSPTTAETKPVIATPSRTAPTSSSGLPVCTDVPAEVDDTVDAVRNNGPYLRPRDDGGTFGNYERLLPRKPSGYYREYTVEAPGQRFPGPRRLITGGQAKLGAEPAVWFYTAATTSRSASSSSVEPVVGRVC